MKNLTQFLFMLLCICLPATAFADANKDKDDDSKYLAGAVPEVDGKVVFTKEFSIPGMSQEEIFKRIQAWMEARLKKKRKHQSRSLHKSGRRTNRRHGRRMDRIQFECAFSGPYKDTLSAFSCLRT